MLLVAAAHMSMHMLQTAPCTIKSIYAPHSCSGPLSQLPVTSFAAPGAKYARMPSPRYEVNDAAAVFARFAQNIGRENAQSHTTQKSNRPSIFKA
jgi:hypothetical protein